MHVIAHIGMMSSGALTAFLDSREDAFISGSKSEATFMSPTSFLKGSRLYYRGIYIRKDTRNGDWMKFKIVLEPAEEGGYTVTVPALPGCISEGDTVDDAIKNIREAIELYLDEDDAELPTGDNIQIFEVTM